MRFAARRFWAHLTRSRARVAWVLTFVGIGLYGIYPSTAPAADPFRQLCLVVSSVAIGAVFLPDLSSNLWDIKEDEVRELIPLVKIRSLQASLVRAQVHERDWATAIIEGGMDPLLDDALKPYMVFVDVSYSVSIHLNRGVTRKEPFNWVTTSLSARRILPPLAPEQNYYVAIARDDVSLRPEFAENGCLLREVVELAGLSDEAWAETVATHGKAQISLDGAVVPAATTGPGVRVSADPRVVRWYFVDTLLEPMALSQERRLVTLGLDYPMSLTENAFYAVFGGYYGIGTTQVDIKVFGGGTLYEVDHQVFFGQALAHKYSSVRQDTDGLCSQFSVTTPSKALLWPGSGLFCRWSATEVEPAKDESNPQLEAGTG